jgi:hypothetical protein
MKNYKIIFSHNEVLLCRRTETELPSGHHGNIFYEHDEETRMLIHAIIKAESEKDAIEEANKLIKNYKHHYYRHKQVA